MMDGLLTTFKLCITLALLPSCNSGKESKASAFLHENSRRYGYTETALVGTSGYRIPFSPYEYSTLYGALDTLETLKVFNTVYFKSVDHYSDLALYEEIVHALQRVVYTSDEISEGPFNLEFEAKLIIDYVDFVNGNQGDTDMALNMMHADVTLQNGSTMTVAEWIDQYAYSNLNVTDFWNYMRVWKSISYGYQNYMMNPRLQPKLISPIISEINNN